MDEKLWAGAELKLQHASFHFDKMGWSLQPPERTQHNVALLSSGAIIDTGWQRSFYAYFDSFLSAARSIPWIIQCCFGEDRANREMTDWFNGLSTDERDRRLEFKKQFSPNYDRFHALRLSTVRNIIEHRSGVAPVTVTISGQFGVTYIGRPVEHIPITETRRIDDPNLAFLARPRPLEPTSDGFEIEGRPLFPECVDYLNAARALKDDGRRIALSVHGTNSLSFPP